MNTKAEQEAACRLLCALDVDPHTVSIDGFHVGRWTVRYVESLFHDGRPVIRGDRFVTRRRVRRLTPAARRAYLSPQ